MESRHCGQDKRIIFFFPVHNASTPCSLQAFGIRCIPPVLFEGSSARHKEEKLLVNPPKSCSKVAEIIKSFHQNF